MFAYLDVYFAFFLALSTYLILIVPIPLVLMSLRLMQPGGMGMDIEIY